MNKRGFTLIELLAVIVILAIIALIAVPVILNMIENARKSAAKSSAYGYIDAINNNNELASMKNEDMGNIPDTISDGTKDVSEINIKIKGKKPTSGEVTITNGRVVSADLCINNYMVNYANNEATVGTKCNGESSTPEPQVAYKCKKATTLSSDGTHTFGTNTGNTLVPGMALDCKVTTDGAYDHRFYYVTDLEGNTDYAVLIYNNNTKVVSGTLSNDNTSGVSYYYDEQENWHGPVTAIEQLPTITDWTNIRLSNSTRKIIAADYSNGHVYADTTTGGTLPTAFSYTGKAARLLTYKEVVTACDPGNSKSKPTLTGYLDNCAYLMENTYYSSSSNTYGYWLESPFIANGSWGWYIYGHSHYVSNGLMRDRHGVRPAIEVKKSEIDLN